MFGNSNDYRPMEQRLPEVADANRQKAHSLLDNPFSENYRGKTSTSSQRTLRYNDFELV